MDDARYSISTVARCFGLPVSTLRYYDEVGRLPPVGRRANVRQYGRPELRRLALIRRLHHEGLLSLDDTATLLADVPAGQTAEPSSRTVLADAISSIEARIADLTNARRLLEHMLTCPRADPVRDCDKLRAILDHAVTAALGGQVRAGSGGSSAAAGRRSPGSPRPTATGR